MKAKKGILAEVNTENSNEPVLKYKNQLNGLDYRKLSPVEHNVLMSVFSTLKEQGKKEVKISFDEFRKLAKLSKKSFSDDDIKPLVETTLSKISLGTIHLENEKGSLYFPIFEKIYFDKNEKEITYNITNTFFAYFNVFKNQYVSFRLRDFTDIKSKYAKNLFRNLMQFRSTGRYIVDYNVFLYDILGIPANLPRFKANNIVVSPAVKELNENKSFEYVKYDFQREGRNIKNIVFDFKVATPNYEQLELVKQHDEQLGQMIEETESEKEQDWDSMMAELNNDTPKEKQWFYEEQNVKDEEIDLEENVVEDTPF